MKAIILEEFGKINRYIKDNFLKLAVTLFVIYVIITNITYFVVKNLPAEQLDLIVKELWEIYNVDTMKDVQGIALFWEIFKNNLRVAGINISSAIIPFLLIPIRNFIADSVVSGMVYGVSAYMGNENMLLNYLKFVLPHAIFEIPVIMLSYAMGIRYSWLVIKKIFRKAKGESLKYHFKRFSIILVLYIIPILLLAAFIEGVVEWWIFGV